MVSWRGLLGGPCATAVGAVEESRLAAEEGGSWERGGSIGQSCLGQAETGTRAQRWRRRGKCLPFESGYLFSERLRT